VVRVEVRGDRSLADPVLRVAALLTFVSAVRSGFAREDNWGYRSLEPSRTVISSIALVLLKTGIQHPPSRKSKTKSDKMGDDESSVSSSEDDDEDSFVDESKKKRDAREDYDEEDEVRIDQNQMSTAQKLLLFWRKPAVSTP
jgi:hypothetical protein